MQVQFEEFKQEDETMVGWTLMGRATIKADTSMYSALVFRTPHGDFAVYLDKRNGVFRKVPVL